MKWLAAWTGQRSLYSAGPFLSSLSFLSATVWQVQIESIFKASLIMLAVCCLEPPLLNSGTTRSWEKIPKHDKWNCWMAQCGLQNLTVSSSVSCLHNTQHEPVELYPHLDLPFSCTIEQIPQAKHKFSKMSLTWVQLCSNGLCQENSLRYLHKFIQVNSTDTK